MDPPSPAPASIPVPDELLEEIFLRLPTLNALSLASAACTSFRRVIKGRALRRRFRALHRTPLLGFMDATGFRPARRRPRPLRRRFLLRPGRRFFFLLLLPVRRPRQRERPRLAPPRRPRRPRPPRLVSLQRCYINNRSYSEERILTRDYGNGRRTKGEPCNAAKFHLAVCHPLSRRYVLLPTIPEDLAAQPQDPLWAFESVLAPATGDDGEEEPFKVICFARYATQLVLFVFSSTTRQWSMSMAASPVFRTLELMFSFNCVRGCFYWTEPYDWSDHLMVLDMRTMRFSTVDLLTGYHVELRDLRDQSHDQSLDGLRLRLNAVVAGRQGALEMFSLVRQQGSFALYHTSLQHNSQEWKLEKIIRLPEQYHDYYISMVGAAEGFLFFQGAPEGSQVDDEECYSMEVKTYEMTKLCSRLVPFFNGKCALPYFSFPPVLLEPTI